MPLVLPPNFFIDVGENGLNSAFFLFFVGPPSCSRYVARLHSGKKRNDMSTVQGQRLIIILLSFWFSDSLTPTVHKDNFLTHN